jgi:small subunit ribosomal protein S16
MAVKIRLTRKGANKDNFFRVVAADSRSPRDGRFIETLGWYDPKREGVNFSLEMERIAYWKSVGAELSETVDSLVRRAAKIERDSAAAENPA